VVGDAPRLEPFSGVVRIQSTAITTNKPITNVPNVIRGLGVSPEPVGAEPTRRLPGSDSRGRVNWASAIVTEPEFISQFGAAIRAVPLCHGFTPLSE